MVVGNPVPSQRMDNIKVQNFFEQNLKRYGLYSPKSLAWNSLESQITRFKVLSQVTSDLSNKKILDVGSGLGDFYHFLVKNFQNIDYTGIEISKDMCAMSKQKYPYLKVYCENFLEFDFINNFDFVFCSGALNIEMPNHREFLESAIKKMWDLCDEGMAFNLPSKNSELARLSSIEEGEPKIAYIDPCEIFSYCKTFCSKIALRHDYMPHDFTVYCYR